MVSSIQLLRGIGWYVCHSGLEQHPNLPVCIGSDPDAPPPPIFAPKFQHQILRRPNKVTSTPCPTKRKHHIPNIWCLLDDFAPCTHNSQPPSGA
mmetsp:Transcript_78412/g.130865  ORF Transcript_78412/g.130865 Transcript_78412/m.130865 type:complete len:94 (-) Transcript_78412:417-698(-)